MKNIDTDKIRPENYQRAFFFERLGYLLMDYVMAHYKRRDFLTVYNNGLMGTWIENSAAEKALENGKEIFSSKENFDTFEAGFRQIIEEADIFIKNSKQLDSITLNNFFNLRAIILKLYYYFEKTEFFFTDACYYGEMSEVLKKNMFTLGDDLKMKSRPMLVELLTTILYHFVGLVSNQYDTDAEAVKFYSIDELVALMESGTIVDSSIITERQKSYIMYSENEAVFEITGEDKTAILEKFKEPDYASMTEFKGVIANKGKVTAKVKVILPKLDIPYEQFVKELHSMDMPEGEILVTETTSPDFVPLMKKAGGIIANQGGLNSHAAIMSRELNVPCLVGTYYATHVLATGDLIELDADNGAVKIIEKASK